MPKLLEALRKNSYVSVPSEVRVKNIASSLRRSLPCIAFGQPNKTRVAVVGAGPSVSENLEEIRNFDGYVVAINGMHDYLIERGIVPDAVIIADSMPVIADFFKNPNDETTYLTCSNCDPSVFDALEGKRVILWHAAKEKDKNGTVGVCTGPSALTSAPYLLYILGYREVHLFGADSSISSSESHIYAGGEPGEVKLQTMVGEEIYLTTGQYILQAAHLWDLNKLLRDDLKIKVHGYGLAKAIFDNNGEFELI